MQIYINDMLYALSGALDSVEAEVFGVKSHHAERVAYIATKLGQSYGMSPEELSCLAAAAVLHDNALTEYISVKRQIDVSDTSLMPSAELLKVHCDMGEKNVQILPFYPQIKYAVLYHHENANGTGPHGLKSSETPIFAQIIHLSDQVDNAFALDDIDEKKHLEIHDYVDNQAGLMFAPQLCNKFHVLFPVAKQKTLYKENARRLLETELPHTTRNYDNKAVEGLATMFAKIVDYKSHFTCTHSLGIAEKARHMGKFYGYDELTCTKLYLAGALHDIGKLTISNAILEKPDSLTREEYAVMKGHALASWQILSQIDGMQDVINWACLHHEKLDGTGYPFGKKAAELNHNERLLACIDIYQALLEDRPYRKGMSHGKAMVILREMSSKGFIDQQITEDIDCCFAAPALL